MKPPHKYASDPTSVHWLNSAFHEVNFSVNKPLSLHISMHQCSEYILLITFSAFVLKYDLIHLIHEARFYIHVLVFSQHNDPFIVLYIVISDIQGPSAGTKQTTPNECLFIFMSIRSAAL